MHLRPPPESGSDSINAMVPPHMQTTDVIRLVCAWQAVKTFHGTTCRLEAVIEVNLRELGF